MSKPRHFLNHTVLFDIRCLISEIVSNTMLAVDRSRLKWLRFDKSLSGIMQFKFRLSADNSLSHLSRLSGTKDQRVLRCVVNRSVFHHECKWSLCGCQLYVGSVGPKSIVELQRIPYDP